MPSRAGSANKNKAFLLKRLQDMYGEDFHPIMKMADNAVRLQAIAETIDDKVVGIEEGTESDLSTSETVALLQHHGKSIQTALEAWDKVAQYTEPKLKAIEVTGAGGGPIESRTWNVTGVRTVDQSGDS